MACYAIFTSALRDRKNAPVPLPGKAFPLEIQIQKLSTRNGNTGNNTTRHAPQTAQRDIAPHRCLIAGHYDSAIFPKQSLPPKIISPTHPPTHPPASPLFTKTLSSVRHNGTTPAKRGSTILVVPVVLRSSTRRPHVCGPCNDRTKQKRLLFPSPPPRYHIRLSHTPTLFPYPFFPCRVLYQLKIPPIHFTHAGF